MSQRITLAHARRAGYCARGMRRWFSGRDISWQQFVSDGAPIEWAIAQRDALADKLVKLALSEGEDEDDEQA